MNRRAFIAAQLSAQLYAACVLATAARAQRIDTTNALAALRDAGAACAADGGRLWGISLRGPIALIDRSTRLVIANDTINGRSYLPLSDAFFTTAPTGGFANTSVEWSGRRWATIVLPLSPDRFDRASLVLHEVFHRVQQDLHLMGADPPNYQLDQMEGRRWFRLELHALASAVAALDSSDHALEHHVESALLFRAQRHRLYPSADTLEPALEMQEGLAEYTGDRLALSLTGESVSRVAGRVRDYERNPTYVRSFAYATGPALGLLLDRLRPSWRADVRTTRDPARLLADAAHFNTPNDLSGVAARRAAEYGGAVIAREEAVRDSARRIAMDDYRRRLVVGPSIVLRQQSLSRGFNPQTLIGYDSASTIYPTGSFSADWGSLEVKSGGALVGNDYQWLRVAAPSRPQRPLDGARGRIEGDGWVLELSPGWTLRAAAGGAFEVVRGGS